MKAAGIVAAILTLPVTIPGSASPLPSRHEAKVRTFERLLRLTELRPDAVDASRAAVTVAGCERRSYGWRCTGSLAPVAFSGIPDSTCVYVVRVFRHTTRLSSGDCGSV